MKNPLTLILLFYLVASALTIYFFDGTGDSGDSIYHYLFAKYAPVHPELFLDHWAKPLFVLLASPFAVFGFNGIKIFNVIVSFFAMYFTAKAAESKGFKYYFLLPLFMMFMPQNYALTFSGLTEPLFALFIAAGLFLIARKKYIFAAIVLSFLPLVRTEGYMILFIVLVFFVFEKSFKSIVYLLCGSVIYSIVGYFYYQDFFWIYTKLPYYAGSLYGHGELFSFIFKLFYIVGVPLFIFFWLGFSLLFLKFFKKFDNFRHVLVLGIFSVYFIAHSLFWYRGMFNSMGLPRVLIGVSPLTALIIAEFFEFLLTIKNKKTTKIVMGILVLYSMVFPFTSNPAALNPNRDLRLNTLQNMLIKTGNFVKNSPELNKGRVFCNQPYYFQIMDIDCFDTTKQLQINGWNLANFKSTDILILTTPDIDFSNELTFNYFIDRGFRVIHLEEGLQNGRTIMCWIWVRK